MREPGDVRDATWSSARSRGRPRQPSGRNGRVGVPTSSTGRLRLTTTGTPQCSCTRARGGGSEAGCAGVEHGRLRRGPLRCATHGRCAQGHDVRPTSDADASSRAVRAAARGWRRRRSARTPPQTTQRIRATSSNKAIRFAFASETGVPVTAAYTTLRAADAARTHTPVVAESSPMPWQRVALRVSSRTGASARLIMYADVATGKPVGHDGPVPATARQRLPLAGADRRRMARALAPPRLMRRRLVEVHGGNGIATVRHVFARRH